MCHFRPTSNILHTGNSLLALRVWALATERAITIDARWFPHAGKTASNAAYHLSRRPIENPNETLARQWSTAEDNKHGTSTNARYEVSLMPLRRKRIVVKITCTTGARYATRLLEILHNLDIETHLIMSKWTLPTLRHETRLSELQVRMLAHTGYTGRDMSAPIASGSFQHNGMIFVPYSMRTLAAVRAGVGDELIALAADVSSFARHFNEINLQDLLVLRRTGANTHTHLHTPYRLSTFNPKLWRR